MSCTLYWSKINNYLQFKWFVLLANILIYRESISVHSVHNTISSQIKHVLTISNNNVTCLRRFCATFIAQILIMISYANLTESTYICKRILIHYVASMSCVVRGLPIRFRYFRDIHATWRLTRPTSWLHASHIQVIQNNILLKFVIERVEYKSLIFSMR